MRHRLALVLALLFAHAAALPAAEESHDIVVYGGTSGGVVAAVQAARSGHTVVLISPTQKLGGLTASGLGTTDTAGYREIIGGLTRDFYRRIHRHYSDPLNWKSGDRDAYIKKHGSHPDGMMHRFEPHVTEKIFEEWAAGSKITIVRGERLDLRHGVIKEGTRITGLRMESGRTFPGKIFIDASYEGDLLPGAGIAHTYGRESAETYQERFAGVQPRTGVEHQFRHPVDPYIKTGDASSGLLPEVHAATLAAIGPEGSTDKLIQAYNFRLCLTDVPENRIPIQRPDGYDPARYELLGRYFKAGFAHPFGLHDSMPNRKSDLNNFGPFSVDYLRGNDGYVEGDYATRDRIIADHVGYQKGLLYFFLTDERVPAHLRQQLAQWGYAKDEFADTGHWPWQIYVREARRMISDHVMTEHHILGKQTVTDSVGLGGYPLDCHNVQRFVNSEGYALVEGGIFITPNNPYPISYRSIVPRRSECENLLVPWSLSASHVAFLSIRMEPVFMVLSQSAATAASLALQNHCAVQDVSYAQLREQLEKQGQALDFKPVRPKPEPIAPASLAGVVVDDLDVTFTDDWVCRHDGRFVGQSFRCDVSHGKDDKTFRYRAILPKPGRYEVRYAYAKVRGASKDVPVTVHTAKGPKAVRLDLSLTPPIDGLWVSLGKFDFDNQEATVVVSNAGTTGAVITDAVQFLPVAP
ncbi:MAG: FAD-dependent oxidoreductase [Verrucomicrobiota bacterium]